MLWLWRDETSPFKVSFLEGGGGDADSIEGTNSRISQFFPKNILLSMAPLECKLGELLFAGDDL